MPVTLGKEFREEKLHKLSVKRGLIFFFLIGILNYSFKSYCKDFQ